MSHMILVLGATGSCGRLFVEHALHDGFTVRCLVRDPARVKANAAYPWANHQRVHLLQGNLSDAETVANACAGVTAAVAMVGPPPRSPVAPAGQSDLLIAIQNVVAGLRKHSVKRLIVQMGAFVKLDSELSLGQRAMRKVFTLATGEAGALAGNDEAARFLLTECGDIDWTIARPGMLSDGPPADTCPAFSEETN